MHRVKEEIYEYIKKRGKAYFGPTTCRDATYDCRAKKQYVQIIYETNKLKELFNGIHEKFLKKLHKHSVENKDASMAHQLKYLSPDNIEMLRQGNKIIQKRYLGLKNTKYRIKRFGLTTWILGWGIYSNMQNIMTIKKNIQALYDQNVLQEKQIIELTHYLNVTYGHVHTNRLVINELNIKVTNLNKTMMAVIGETKFIKYTVAILTDMRMMLAQLSLGVMSLQENINTIYEYMRVLSTRRVNPLIIPPDSL